MSTKRPEAKAESLPPPEERLKVFLAHKPKPKPRRPDALERLLLDIWKCDDESFAEKGANLLTPDELETLSDSIRMWQSRRAGKRELLFSAVFEALPEPVVAFTPDGAVWNRAFVDAIAGAHEWKAYPLAPHSDRLSQLAEFVTLARRLCIPRLLYPLGEQAYQLRTVRLESEAFTFLYFRPTGLTLPRFGDRKRQLLVFRLCGIPLKQIALLLGVSLSTVETQSSRLRTHFLQLRSDFLALPQ